MIRQLVEYASSGKMPPSADLESGTNKFAAG